MHRLTLLLLPLILSASACSRNEPGKEKIEPADAAYAGSASCASCHAEQTKAWRGSHHDLAMQVATDETVLGDFDEAVFTHQGVTSTFNGRNGNFFVATDGPDGELDEFPVRYTFGVEPLQQYLVELPDGKLQALGTAWDSRAESAGWFHVYGDEPIDHTDVLHWTRPSQNWETMCADCHSTGLVKRYDVDADRFDTTWAEIDVACEACHGPGRKHVDWARSGATTKDAGLVIAFDERDDVRWILDPRTGNSKRSEPRMTSHEIDTCAPCHSRRARIAESTGPGGEFLDAFLPALIQPPLYHTDGQIDDEVYVYGSFLQSRMHQQGVTCSDCHEPHSLELRAPDAQVCAQCHDNAVYATAEHHRHPPDSRGANCLDCHMPAKTYMQIDARRDHSFRIPRLALSAEHGTPEPCTACHADKDADWAADTWPQNETDEHWTSLLTSDPRDAANRTADLTAIIADPAVPHIIRATAFENLPLDEQSLDLLQRHVGDESSLVRWTIARNLQRAPARTRLALAPPLLDDPVRAVRLSAAIALAPLGVDVIPPVQQARLDEVYSEYEASQRLNLERAESHINLANLAVYRGRVEDAENAYMTAIRINNDFVPGYVNLADLYRSLGREADAEALLRAGIERLAGQSALHESLGLLLVRTRRLDEAVGELRVATAGEDATARTALAYALALEAQGNTGAAIAELEAARVRFGDVPDLVTVLTDLSNRSGNSIAP